MIESGPTYIKKNPEHMYSAFAIALQNIIDSTIQVLI